MTTIGRWDDASSEGDASVKPLGRTPEVVGRQNHRLRDRAHHFAARQQLTPEEQLAELKAERTLVETRQRAIAREIAELEAARTPALREAEAVARAADKRAPDHA